MFHRHMCSSFWVLFVGSSSRCGGVLWWWVLGTRDEDAVCQSVTVEQVPNERYKCTVPECNKAFKAPEFVKKHVQKKHTELIEAAAAKVWIEIEIVETE